MGEGFVSSGPFPGPVHLRCDLEEGVQERHAHPPLVQGSLTLKGRTRLAARGPEESPKVWGSWQGGTGGTDIYILPQLFPQIESALVESKSATALRYL